MKRSWKWLPLLWLLAGCLPPDSAVQEREVQLTPYLLTQPDETASAPVPTSALSPTPQATPTPFFHPVALGETISDIALRYGVSMDAIISANPDVKPNAMVVGMELVIPGVQISSAGEQQQAISLQLSEPVCLPASRGGWWCTSWVQNDQASDVGSISIAFTLTDASGNQLARFNTPALLDWLPPSGRIPASLYFPPPIQDGSQVIAELQSAVAINDAASRFLPVEVQILQTQIENRLARVKAKAILPTQINGEISVIWAAALAFDEDDRLVGARRIEMIPGTDELGEIEFTIYVYSANAVIDRVEMLAEAHIQQTRKNEGTP